MVLITDLACTVNVDGVPLKVMMVAAGEIGCQNFDGPPTLPKLGSASKNGPQTNIQAEDDAATLLAPAVGATEQRVPNRPRSVA